jgi:MATE family multidrug resistance protein
MFVTITGLSVATGAALSLDTLCSQSFTYSDDKTIVGLHVQRCLAFMSVLYIPIVALWWNAEDVFLLLRQEPQIAALSAIFVRWMILAAPAFALFEALKKMLQAQGIFNAPTYVLILGTPLNFILNYVFVWIPGWSMGFQGAAIASVITYWVIVVLMALYIFMIDGSKAWPAWSTRAAYNWRQWGPMVKLAVPGILLICTETWAYEIIALGASWIDTTNLGAQSVILTSIVALYTLVFGVGIASANRVGNLLGAQRPKQARIASRVALAVGFTVAFGNAITMFMLRSKWAYFFTDDKEVADIVSNVLPLVAGFVLFDNIAGVADGVMNGMGRQHVGAWCNLGAYYFFALPLGFYLCFRSGWGLTGLWFALLVALFVASLITVLVVVTSDWQKEALKAEERSKEEVSCSSSSSSSSSNSRSATPLPL